MLPKYTQVLGPIHMTLGPSGMNIDAYEEVENVEKRKRIHRMYFHPINFVIFKALIYKKKLLKIVYRRIIHPKRELNDIKYTNRYDLVNCQLVFMSTQIPNTVQRFQKCFSSTSAGDYIFHVYR